MISCVAMIAQRISPFLLQCQQSGTAKSRKVGDESCSVSLVDQTKKSENKQKFDKSEFRQNGLVQRERTCWELESQFLVHSKKGNQLLKETGKRMPHCEIKPQTMTLTSGNTRCVCHTCLRHSPSFPSCESPTSSPPLLHCPCFLFSHFISIVQGLTIFVNQLTRDKVKYQKHTSPPTTSSTCERHSTSGRPHSVAPC